MTPAQYFNKKRGIANGIVYAGGGLGGTAISFAMDALIQKLGIAWTFRVLGIAMLVTGLPAAWLIKERAPIKTTTFIEWFVAHLLASLFDCMKEKLKMLGTSSGALNSQSCFSREWWLLSLSSYPHSSSRYIALRSAFPQALAPVL